VVLGEDNKKDKALKTFFGVVDFSFLYKKNICSFIYKSSSSHALHSATLISCTGIDRCQ